MVKGIVKTGLDECWCRPSLARRRRWQKRVSSRSSRLPLKWNEPPAKSSPAFPPTLSLQPPIAPFPSDSVKMGSRPELKEEDDAGFCRFFRNLPEQHSDTVRIFDRGDYYSAHGEDAKFIANNVSYLILRVAQRSMANNLRFIEQQPSSASWVVSQASNP